MMVLLRPPCQAQRLLSLRKCLPAYRMRRQKLHLHSQTNRPMAKRLSAR